MTAAPSLAELDDFDDGGMDFRDTVEDGGPPSGADQPQPQTAPTTTIPHDAPPQRPPPLDD